MARRFGRTRIARPAAPPSGWVLKVGARVRSAPVARRAAFVGVVTGHWYGEKWFVRDDAVGNEWVRFTSDLSDPGDEA